LFPSEFQRKIQVIHDGIDTAALVPRGDTFKHPKLARTFTTGDEVLTYVARNLEPYRGFHIFMRALPAILERRPNAHVCIVGGESVSYGAAPDGSKSWKSAFLKECAGQLDMSRVHFLGHIDYESYVSLLRVSRAHVYLTYPFVLSWSLLEAMALECLVVASDTAPITEVIRNGDNGIIVPFFDPAVLASRVSEALSSPEKFSHLKKNARKTVLDRYCFKDQCYPRIIALLEQLIVESQGKFSSPRASLEPSGRRKLLIPHGLA
jgi:glycosyltransferase involved in cell wall biosynthesis